MCGGKAKQQQYPQDHATAKDGGGGFHLPEQALELLGCVVSPGDTSAGLPKPLKNSKKILDQKPSSGF